MSLIDAWGWDQGFGISEEKASDVEAEPVEMKPVIHAHWEDRGWAGIVCSNCQENALENRGGYEILSKYCPFCGAQMDEEVKK